MDGMIEEMKELTGIGRLRAAIEQWEKRIDQQSAASAEWNENWLKINLNGICCAMEEATQPTTFTFHNFITIPLVEWMCWLIKIE